MKTVRCLLAGLVAVALAQATPLDLHQKPGAKPNQLAIPPTSPCGGISRSPGQRTISDEIDLPLIVLREEQGHCIATAVPPVGFFSVEDEVSAVPYALDPEDLTLIEGTGLFGGLLIVTVYAANKLRPSRHRHAHARRRPGSRRSMAVI